MGVWWCEVTALLLLLPQASLQADLNLATVREANTHTAVRAVNTTAARLDWGSVERLLCGSHGHLSHASPCLSVQCERERLGRVA